MVSLFFLPIGNPKKHQGNLGKAFKPGPTRYDQALYFGWKIIQIKPPKKGGGRVLIFWGENLGNG